MFLNNAWEIAMQKFFCVVISTLIISKSKQNKKYGGWRQSWRKKKCSGEIQNRDCFFCLGVNVDDSIFAWVDMWMKLCCCQVEGWIGCSCYTWTWWWSFCLFEAMNETVLSINETMFVVLRVSCLSVCGNAGDTVFRVSGIVTKIESLCGQSNWIEK